jgi:hypothetical protein
MDYAHDVLGCTPNEGTRRLTEAGDSVAELMAYYRLKNQAAEDRRNKGKPRDPAEQGTRLAPPKKPKVPPKRR